jgi:hypothetical protein
MTKEITFAQHIRTSSKARRGFRTFKKTVREVNEQLDETLGTYGVYTPTQYRDFRDRLPEDYPILFMFYNLNNRYRILCRSTYEGEDLHSYPPRAGNYIAHSLICGLNERFNLIEMLLHAPWKTKKQIIEEDDVANPVGINIDSVPLPDCKSYEVDACLNRLLGNDPKRQNMFVHAVDAIIDRKQVVIVDDIGSNNNRLTEWMFALISVFPIEFVFKNMNISSFANSNQLLEVCNILCVETQNIEKLARYIDESNWEIIDGSVQHKPTYYSNILIECVEQKEGKNFNEFRENVLDEFEPSSSYTRKYFEKLAHFYFELPLIHQMDDEKFNSFLLFFIDEEKKRDKIFDELKNIFEDEPNNFIKNKILNFWIKFAELIRINQFNEFKFKHLLEKYVPNNLLPLWIDFERETIPRIDFQNDIMKVLKYYELPNQDTTERLDIYYPFIIGAIKSIKDPEYQSLVINKTLSFVSALTNSHKADLNELKRYVKVCQEINAKNGVGKLLCFYKNYEVFKPENLKKEIYRLIAYIPWDQVFNLLRNERNDCLKFFLENGPSQIFSNKDLTFYLCQDDITEYESHIYEEFMKLNKSSQKEFLANSPKTVQQLIIRNISIENLPELEKQLTIYSGTENEIKLIENLLANIEHNNDLWSLCFFMMQKPSAEDGTFKYPNIRKISKSGRKIIYDAVANESVEIPIDYFDFAEELIKRKIIRRKLPEKNSNLKLIGGNFIEDLTNFIGFKKKYNNSTLSAEYLIETINSNLPWDFYKWEELCKQLSQEEIEQIPRLLYRIINSHSPKNETFLYHQWCYIACEFIIRLIVIDKPKSLKNCLGILAIDSTEYGFILQRLLCILGNEDNNSRRYFNDLNSEKRLQQFKNNY